MDCKTSSNLMMSYIDRTISEREWAGLQEHIASCNKCRDEFTLFMEMQSLMEGMEMVEPDSNFELKVMESIDRSLYKKGVKESRGFRELIISIVAYLTLLLGVQGVQYSLQQNSYTPMVLFDYLLSIGSFFDKVVMNGMLLVLYPRKILMMILHFISQVSFTGILAYGVGLLILMILLATIQTTLFRMLKNI